MCDGFVLRLDLWLGSRAGCVVIDMQPMLQLRLDEELRPRARLQLRGVADGSVMATVAGELALPLRRWVTLELGCDGETAWLAIDGREIGRAAAEGTPQQEPDMVFTLSPPDAPVPGMVDELRWFVFSFSPVQMLPIELQPRRSYRLGYDVRGEPVAHPEVQWEDLEQP
jgi:hypothetical protein